MISCPSSCTLVSLTRLALIKNILNIHRLDDQRHLEQIENKINPNLSLVGLKLAFLTLA